mgnify:CR=1 FL=1
MASFMIRFFELLADRLAVGFGRAALWLRDQKYQSKFRSLGLYRHSVLYEGQRFCYYRGANRRKPPLILLHGFLDRGFAFRHVVADLVGDFDLIVIDLPGHGSSALPPVRELWTAPSIYRSLYRFIVSLTDDQPLMLTHSMGGLMALQMQRYAESIGGRPVFRELCAVAPGALLLASNELNELRRRFFPQSKEEVRHLLSLLYFNKPDEVAKLGDFIIAALLHRWSKIGFQYLAMNTLERPDEVFLTEMQMRSIHAKLVLIWGGDDQIIPLKQGKKMAKALRSKLHIVDHAGHNILSENSRAVVDIVQKLWLSS